MLKFLIYRQLKSSDLYGRVIPTLIKSSELYLKEEFDDEDLCSIKMHA